MTIQRQYSLPNCTLVLDGLGDGSALMNMADTRPLMSMLINAECRLMGKEPLSGGRDFFDSLVNAVNQYVQEVLSGIHRSQGSASSLVRLQRLDGEHHRLSVTFQPPMPEADGDTQTGKQVVLSTVELFDLAEAIDQFLADARTLPDFVLNLKPVPKRAVSRSGTVNQQVVPAAVGLSGLAAAAVAFALIPTPKIQEPPDLVASRTATSQSASPNASPNASPTASPNASPSAVATPDVARLEAQLASAPEIKDTAQIEALRGQVASKLEAAWKTRSLTEESVYRLGVGSDGAIVGYKAVSPNAAANAKQTPLADLPYTTNRATTEPLAQFKAVFTPDGKITLTPWTTETAAAAEATGQISDGKALEITDAAQLKDLQPKVYETLNAGLAGAPKFANELVYRVRVKADGSVVDYLPDNAAAREHDAEMPIAKLAPQAQDDAPATESLAWFKAVIKPNGTLELSPWRGAN
jgi:hypothetical protein